MNQQKSKTKLTHDARVKRRIIHSRVSFAERCTPSPVWVPLNCAAYRCPADTHTSCLVCNLLDTYSDTGGFCFARQSDRYLHRRRCSLHVSHGAPLPGT